MVLSLNSDRTTGALFLLCCGSGFVYYTLWVLVTPFIEDGHVLLSYFPDRQWAIIIPVVLLVVTVTGVGAFLALVMIRSGNKLSPQPLPAATAHSHAS